MEKKPVSYFVVGIILGMVSIILFLVYYFTGLSFQKTALSWLPPLVTIGMLIYFVVQYSNAKRNYVTFGELFGYGFKSTIILTLISFAFTALALYIIFPDYKDKVLEMSRLQMEQQSSISEQQKDASINFMEKSFNLLALGGTLFANIIIGIIGSLLGAAIAKKNPVTPFNQTV
ncbi:MAG: DUF4199 domain-containing protein [Williamsia sp.]|nr:DUF4199 domain-containing protein [Williamsia sp.]